MYMGILDFDFQNLTGAGRARFISNPAGAQAGFRTKLLHLPVIGFP